MKVSPTVFELALGLLRWIGDEVRIRRSQEGLLGCKGDLGKSS